MNYYFKWTGNPFVDNGIAAILSFCNKKEPEKITKKDIELMCDILYVLYIQDKWVKDLYTALSGNTHVTAPRAAGKKTLKLKYLKEELTKLKNDITYCGKEGNCIACGSRDSRNPINRSSIPLSGFMNNNFLSYNYVGADYCSACTLASQFMPLVGYKCGNKVMILQSNNINVILIWAKQLIKKVKEQISTGNYSGIYDNGYSNPKNALFHITTDLIITHIEPIKIVKKNKENISIRLYNYTNYNQLPLRPLEIYDLPTPVFTFLRLIKIPEYNKMWKLIVKRGFNEKKIKNKTEEEYKNTYNDVYEKLLKNQNILNYLLNHKYKKTYCNWEFLSIYLKEIRFMQKERIQAIKELADKISELIILKDNAKRINQIQQATKYDSFRNVLLKIWKDWILIKKETPLIDFDILVEHIFPEGALSWKETQDLILFRLYEKLQKWLINKNELKEDEEDEEDDVDDITK